MWAAVVFGYMIDTCFIRFPFGCRLDWLRICRVPFMSNSEYSTSIDDSELHCIAIPIAPDQVGDFEPCW